MQQGKPEFCPRCKVGSVVKAGEYRYTIPPGKINVVWQCGVCKKLVVREG